MSSNANPFQSPPNDPFQTAGYYAPVKPVGFATPQSTRTSMSWGESISYVFGHPDAMMNLLFGAICQLIPVVGPLVFMGYQFETAIDLTLTQGANYRAFDWNRFTAYLKRGLWPFLVMLVLSAIFAAVAVPLFYIVMLIFGLLAGAAGRDAGLVIGIMGMILFMGLTMALSIGFQMLTQPLVLRAALTQNFADGFQFNFALDFVKRMWKEMLVAFLFQAFAGMLIMLVGFLALCIGIYPAVVVILLMQAHINFQLYELYRARGGEVIPITSVD